MIEFKSKDLIFYIQLSRLYLICYNIINIDDSDVARLKEKGKSKVSIKTSMIILACFAFMLSYKAGNAGKNLIKADPTNTTRRNLWGNSYEGESNLDT